MGTDARATTPGTTENEVRADEPPIRFRGDEADLFLAFNDELSRRVGSAVDAHPADIEDACAFAWVQFFRHQPERERNWRGWLFRTAQREAWRLNARHGAERPMLNDTESFGVDPRSVPADPRDRYEERLDFLAALEELDKLPERLKAVVLVRSQVEQHAEVAEVLGISRQRVAFLLRHVTVALQEMSERRLDAERPVASPRAARLRELEDNPPPWLVNEIGRNGGRGKSDAGSKLAWRRAALAIDDYRRVSGWESPSEAIGSAMEPAAVRAQQRAERAVGHLREQRQRRHGYSRER